MAAPMDWAAFSEADEESRQTLLKRAVKIEPSLQVVLTPSAKKCKRKVSEKSEKIEGHEDGEKKSHRSASKKSSSRKTLESKKDDEPTIGSNAWVERELESVGLGAFAKSFGDSLPLELLIYADAPHLDVLLRSSRTEPFPDVMDYIKLQCLIRSMYVKVTGSTGGNRSKVTNFALQSQGPSSYVPYYVNQGPLASTTDDDKSARLKLLEGDILQWRVEQVQQWLNATPDLKKFAPAFLQWKIDGRRLMALNDRHLLQRFKLESEVDRASILSHVTDLKSLQLIRAASMHGEVLNKIMDSLAAEMGIEKVSASIPITGPILSDSSENCIEREGIDSERLDDAARKDGLSVSKATSLAPGLTSKRVPNFFISLRIAAPEIRDNVIAIQKEIEAQIPELIGSRSMLPHEQLHFTLGRLYLQTESEVNLAKRLLEEAVEKVYHRLYAVESETTYRQLAVNFKGVQNYGGNTVFLETERGLERDLLIEFGNSVYDLFQEAGLTSKEFRFQPVAPIIRVRQSKKPLLLRLQDVSQTLLMERYSDAPLGRAIFASLDISAVADQTDEDGYYKNLHTVSLN